MSIEAHLETIANKREELKNRIAAEMAHPHPDLTLITKLKKQNLMLKEEMQHYFKLLKTAAAS